MRNSRKLNCRKHGKIKLTQLNFLITHELINPNFFFFSIRIHNHIQQLHSHVIDHVTLKENMEV
jgi:hypothetical protein